MSGDCDRTKAGGAAASLVGERRGLRTTAQQPSGAIAGSRIVSDSRIGSTAPSAGSGDCVNGLAQLPSRDGREVDKQVAAPAETRTPNLHRAKQKSLTKSADGRVATGLVWAQRKN